MLGISSGAESSSAQSGEKDLPSTNRNLGLPHLSSYTTQILLIFFNFPISLPLTVIFVCPSAGGTSRSFGM